MKIPLALFIAILSLALSSAAVVVSVRQEFRINAELERLSLAYFRFEEDYRAYGRKVDAANREAEQNFKLNLPSSSEMNKALSDSLRKAINAPPEISPHVPPAK